MRGHFVHYMALLDLSVGVFLMMLTVSLRLCVLSRSLPMITVSCPWMNRIKNILQVCLPYHTFPSKHLEVLHERVNTALFTVCVCLQVRRWCSSALEKVFCTMPSRATTPVSLLMDKLVMFHHQSVMNKI